LISKQMMWILYEHPNMDFDAVLDELKFKEIPQEEIVGKIPFLKKKFNEIRISSREGVESRWIMGQLSKLAIGNISLTELNRQITA
jgi:hypothetical protein